MDRKKVEVIQALKAIEKTLEEISGKLKKDHHSKLEAKELSAARLIVSAVERRLKSLESD